MNIKNIVRFIYWHAIPISVGAVVFYYLNKADSNDINKFFPMMLEAFGFCFIFIMIHGWIGLKIFPEKPTLADKMMRCKLRRKYGGSYCADCPDSYTCPTDLGPKKVGKEEKVGNEEKADKGEKA